MKKFKVILLFILLIGTFSCGPTMPSSILQKNQYKIVDTLETSVSGFNRILSYDVIIKYDSAYHYGVIDTKGNLTRINVKKITLDD